MPDRIYVYDEIAVPHTRWKQLRGAYLEQYVPGARARGMTLEGAWRSPPIDLPDRASTLHFLWSLPDAAAWWKMRLDAIEEKTRWWSFVDSIAVSRKRTVMIDAMDGSGSDNV